MLYLKIWSNLGFSTLKVDTINQFKLNLARKHKSLFYPVMPNLTLISKEGGYYSPYSSNFAAKSFFFSPHSGDNIHR